MNPIVYALNPDFRAAYKRIFYTALRRCGWSKKDGRSGSNGSGIPRDFYNVLPLNAADGDVSGSRRSTARNYASLGITQTPMSQLNGLHDADRVIDETAPSQTAEPP